MERIITVTGEGSSSQKPDQASINGEIHAVCDTYEEAVSKSTSCVSVLRASLVDAGFDADILRTVSVSVRPNYDTAVVDGYHRSVLNGYVYSHSIRIDTRADDGSVDRILAALSSSDAPQFSLDYTVSDPSHAKEAARREAVYDACEKAAQLSSAAGVGLGRIMSIRYRSDDSGPVMRMCAKVSNGPSSVVPEAVEFTDTVVMEWELI